MRIHFIGTETTGTGSEDEPLSIAIACWDDGKIDTRYVGYYHPLGPVHPEAQSVNGYTPSVWANEHRAEPCFCAGHAGHVANALQDAVALGGSNTSFHEHVLRTAFVRVRAVFPSIGSQRVDTGILAVPLLVTGKVGSTGRGTLAKYFGVAGVYDKKLVNDLFTSIRVFESLVNLYWNGVSHG